MSDIICPHLYTEKRNNYEEYFCKLRVKKKYKCEGYIAPEEARTICLVDVELQKVCDVKKLDKKIEPEKPKIEEIEQEYIKQLINAKTCRE